MVEQAFGSRTQAFNHHGIRTVAQSPGLCHCEAEESQNVDSFSDPPLTSREPSGESLSLLAASVSLRCSVASRGPKTSSGVGHSKHDSAGAHPPTRTEAQAGLSVAPAHFGDGDFLSLPPTPDSK